MKLLAIGCQGKQENNYKNPEFITCPTYPWVVLSASSVAFAFSVSSLFKYIPRLPLWSADVLCLVDISLGLLFHCYLFRAKRQNALKPPGCQGYFSLVE